MTIKDRLTHFWHVISNVRPIFWITLYLCFVPLFALFYWLLPDGEFRIPDGGAVDYGGWLYYSIVTITTLGFGDYTPAMPGAQCLTAIEVLVGMVTIGFFLNAVGSMKSEIDVASEIEKQRRLHEEAQRDKLVKNTPICLHKLNEFLSYCYAITTPLSERDKRLKYNANFTLDDMVDMNKPSGLPDDHSGRTALQSFLMETSSTVLFLDSLQARIDLSLWPKLLEDCFSFVANWQMLSAAAKSSKVEPELMHFIRTNAALASNIEVLLTQINAAKQP